MAFKPADPPKSLLGRYRVMGPTAGIRVSPLCLGTMNFGTQWAGFMGACDKQRSFEILGERKKHISPSMTLLALAGKQANKQRATRLLFNHL